MDNSVGDAIVRWATDNPDVRRVWIFASRNDGGDSPDSGLELAIELAPVGDSEETLTRWIAQADFLKSQLQQHGVPKVGLQWFDPNGGMRPIDAQLNGRKALIYESANELETERLLD